MKTRIEVEHGPTNTTIRVGGQIVTVIGHGQTWSVEIDAGEGLNEQAPENEVTQAVRRLGLAQLAIKRWSELFCSHSGLGPPPNYDRAAHGRDTEEWHAAERAVFALAKRLAEDGHAEPTERPR